MSDDYIDETFSGTSHMSRSHIAYVDSALDPRMETTIPDPVCTYLTSEVSEQYTELFN